MKIGNILRNEESSEVREDKEREGERTMLEEKKVEGSREDSGGEVLGVNMLLEMYG